MAEATERKIVELPGYLTVRELADRMHASPIEVIKELMGNGVMASINQQIDYDTAAIVAAEMGFEPQPEIREEDIAPRTQGGPAWRRLYDEEESKNLVTRPPVITILGHVDHGKTSLLDRIREANVAGGEAGGITQHIGAYQIEHQGRKITFLDTPGHEAFTAMRARGAQGADIAILVVAADDGVMPQTREAIAHAKAAGVPIIVALNKVDKDNANPDRVKQQLSEQGLVPDEWDGDTMVIPVSARTGNGMEDLVEAILLVADDTQITANPKGDAAGTVIESQMDKFRGVMATILVQNGTLEKGDVILAGTAYGRIKAMFNDRGEEIKTAGPSMPVRIMGLNALPPAGTLFETVKSDKVAREIVATRAEAAYMPAAQKAAFTLEDLYARFQAGEAKELNLIVKADVQGSLEPIVTSLEKLRVKEEERELKVNIIHADIGPINESDVMLASTTGAIMIGFGVEPDGAAKRRADSEHVEIRTYNVIYQLLDEVELALEGMLEPVYEDKVIGVAEVREVFNLSKGTVAGSYVREGEARRNAKARVIRNHQAVHEGGISALKRFQEDVREVRTGFECGITLDNFNDFKQGDMIQFLVRERVR
jgi:translation initiation factor IF-2